MSFGAALDLVPFMAADSLDQPPPYLLYGIIVHISPFSAGGHYVAYVKAGDGNWYECDDSSVTEVDEDEVLSQTAYMLFYRRASPRSWSGCQRSADSVYAVTPRPPRVLVSRYPPARTRHIVDIFYLLSSIKRPSEKQKLYCIVMRFGSVFLNPMFESSWLIYPAIHL